MIRITGLILALLLVAPQKPETGKIKSTVDKSVDFAAFQTYTWLKGQPANDQAVHKAIVAAVDSELGALGLRKVESGASDVTVRYMAVRSSYVDLDRLDEVERKGGDSRQATHSVGRLVVVVEHPMSARRFWTADTVQILDPEPGERDAMIKGVVSQMFANWPTRNQRR
jgi:hypothetical protein